MDKPFSMPLKEYLLRIMSVSQDIPEKTIEAVMEYQFKGVVEAMLTSDIYSVEVSGFGKFIFNKNKALKKDTILLNKKIELEEKLKNENLSETVRNKHMTDLLVLSKWIEGLKQKVDGDTRSVGRVAKQVVSHKKVKKLNS